MNEEAIKLEEQIINRSREKELGVCQGWILRKDKKYLWVYPLYYRFAEENVPEKIRECEEIAKKSGRTCIFRIAEYTNYYLSAVLADNGYTLREQGVVGKKDKERILADISGQERLPAEYEQAGFCEVYRYRCYQKREDEEDGFTK